MFNDSQNRQLFQAAKEWRLVEFDYPYYSMPRNCSGQESNQKLRKILGKNDAVYSYLIDEMDRLKNDIGRIPASSDPAGIQPYWANDWLTPLDAVSLYTLIRIKKPKVYLEIGSGNSTKFARRAISDGELSTQIVSIDPQPRAEIDKICDVLDRRTLESLSETDILKYVTDGDIVFFDGSHRSFQGSDVTVFFSEILPVLPVGIIYGIHDIFLPGDYPEAYRQRFFNEQYLLLSYLYGGCGGDEVIFPASYIGTHPTLSTKCQNLIDDLAYKDLVRGGCAFWLQRFKEI